jgi:hypothetical protein
MNPENSTQLFLDMHEEQARLVKGFIYNDYIKNRVRCENIDKAKELDFLNSILNIQMVVNAGLCVDLYQDTLQILEQYQKQELIELYRVKTVRDLKELRARILAQHDYGN